MLNTPKNKPLGENTKKKKDETLGIFRRFSQSGVRMRKMLLRWPCMQDKDSKHSAHANSLAHYPSL